MKKSYVKSLVLGALVCTAMTVSSCGEKKAATADATETEKTEQEAAPGARKKVEKPADLHKYSEKEMAPGMQNTYENVAFAIEPVGEMMKGNMALKNIYFDHKMGMIATSAFQDCKNLENIYSDDEIMVFGDYSFAGCTALKTLDANTYTIGEHAFEGCTALETVKLANLPQMDLREKAFAGCTALKTVLLGLECDQIKENAFDGCTALEEVAVPYNRKDNMYAITSASKNIKKLFILTPAFYQFPTKSAAKAFNKAQCVVYVPDACINDFKADPDWSAFQEVKPLSESGYYTAEGELK